MINIEKGEIAQKGIDNVAIQLDRLERFETGKKNSMTSFLKILQDLKSSGDEDKVKSWLSELLKTIIPRLIESINAENSEFKEIKEITDKLRVQKKLLENQLDFYARRYIDSKEKLEMNAYYEKIFPIIKSFLKLCELTEKTRIKT